MYKKQNLVFIWFILLILILVIMSIFLIKNNNDKKDLTKKKLEAEMSYLDSHLVDMLNKANGISLENYIVQAEKVKDEKKSKSETSTGSSSSSEGTSSNDSSGSSSDSDSSEQSDSDSSKNNINYKMISNEILLQDLSSIDWNSLKSDVEKLYTDWSTIVLDLYKVNVNSQDILNFSTELDIATTVIQKEDKANTLTLLAKLYSYIPKYNISFSENSKSNNIYQTKSYILNAYSLVEQDDFLKIKDELSSAETAFMPILSDISSNPGNQSNINKTYILIKELENFDANTNKEIFYIKYKNLMQNLNNIKV